MYCMLHAASVRCVLRAVDAWAGPRTDRSCVPDARVSVRSPRSVQDVFLVGPPGPHRRRLAMWYAQVTNQEVEYCSISRDTTDSDLKQRREIADGTALYVDQAPVRAAVHGRVLILDGIEKAERNVLPTLNNLLENR